MRTSDLAGRLDDHALIIAYTGACQATGVPIIFACLGRLIVIRIEHTMHWVQYNLYNIID